MKKKTLILMLSVVAVAAAAIGGTLAYFSFQANPANNTFTVGNVKIELTEPDWNADNASNVYPGETLAKNPIVTNIGSNPCMVRIKVEKDDRIILVGVNSNWTLDEDGYYYYNSALAPGEATPALFTGIQVPDDFTNEDSGGYSVKVTAQAVQSEGYDSTSLSEVKAVFGSVVF